jgi:hypothetical protein
MKKEKGYEKLRLGVMKKLNQGSQSIQGSNRKYEARMSLPILGNHHRYDPWVMELENKMAIREFDI